jgi:LMBR1 domain-containing protein 1
MVYIHIIHVTFLAIKSFFQKSDLIFQILNLFLYGIFIPFDPMPEDTSNLSQWQIVEDIIQKNVNTDNSKVDNLLVFLLNVLSCVGMIILIVYTAYGMSSLPFSMIKGQRTIYTDKNSIEKEIEDLENQIRLLKERFDGEEGNMNDMDIHHLERLEQQVRLLQRRRRSLEQSARSFVNRLVLICRPFQFIVGSILALFGFLIFLSLLLTSIDKAINSLGPKSGYILQNGTLPNPVDLLLVEAQSVFPLDYIIYCVMILLFLFCSMTGIQTIGIRFLWLSVYKIRAQKTKPQAIVLMCLNLIFVLLASNVIMFSVVPDYTTYGNQNFINNTDQKVEVCKDIEKLEHDCNMSRISVLLLAFHYKAWIFGVAYYYLIWLFLLVVVAGAVYKMYELRNVSNGRNILEEEQEEEEDPDSILHQDPNSVNYQ